MHLGWGHYLFDLPKPPIADGSNRTTLEAITAEWISADRIDLINETRYEGLSTASLYDILERFNSPRRDDRRADRFSHRAYPRRDLAGYYAMIENLDWNVGRVVAALREEGLYDEVDDLSGQQVRRLVDHYQEGGRYQVSWDGSDETGDPLSSGVYLLRLQALGRVETRKMMLMR